MRKLKNPTYFSQWTSFPHTHLSNLSILEKTTLPLPLKDTTILPLFFSPSTSQYSISSRLFNFNWKLLGALPHSFRTFSISHYFLANLFASSLLIAPFILVSDAIMLKSKVQNKSTIIVGRKVWNPFVGVRRDECNASVGKPFGWKRWRLGTWPVTSVLGGNNLSRQA